MQKAKHIDPGVRPNRHYSRTELWAGGAGLAGAKVLTFEFIPYDQPSFPSSQFFLLLLLNQILAPVITPHLLHSPSWERAGHLEPWDRLYQTI